MTMERRKRLIQTRLIGMAQMTQKILETGPLGEELCLSVLSLSWFSLRASWNKEKIPMWYYGSDTTLLQLYCFFSYRSRCPPDIEGIQLIQR